MKDAKCAETNEKSIFRFFPICSFWDMVVFVLKIGQFFDKIDHNAKTKNRKNLITDEEFFFCRIL